MTRAVEVIVQATVSKEIWTLAQEAERPAGGAPRASAGAPRVPAPVGSPSTDAGTAALGCVNPGGGAWATAAAPGATGNPVFDYRAGLRRAAAAAQRWLTMLGLVLAAMGGSGWLWFPAAGNVRRAAGWEFVIGLVCFAAGIIWGFAWRGGLRRGFRRAHGLERQG